MKNIILITMILVLALGVTAQDMKRERKGNGEYAWMKENLGLTETQKTSLESINKSMREEVKGAQEMDETDRREKMKVYRTKKDSAYKTVLSTDQFSKLESHRLAIKQGRKSHGKEKLGTMNPQEMASKKVAMLKTELILTDDQEAKLNAAYYTFFTAKREVGALPRETDTEKEVAKTKIKIVQKELKDVLDSTLSREQKDKMKENRKSNMESKGKRK